ncbi:MAG: DUF1080 domain-containing protein [Candidatus Omnitrophota bacterium]|jgi:hypothetical protein|nr:MAG: DUF1080 domain-containing protein [Candidatus Omnitrophota bacterium]
MKKFVVFMLFVSSFVLTGSTDNSKWLNLFNGKDLTGWTGVHDVDFDVHDGNLRLIKGMGWLRTEQVYDDFILEFECKALVENYDSGIFIRSGLEGKPWPDAGLQINLKNDMLGALVRGNRAVLKSEVEPLPVGEWMKFRLTANGINGKLELNDEEVWETDMLDMIDLQRGLIGIQAENKSFEFRNIRIQEIGAVNLLTGHGKEFEHLMVQEGSKEAWSLNENGELVCSGEKGGWIGTKTDDYSDFVLSLEYNVPKEGNSGVYIRYPGKGRASYEGMEIQILDDDAVHWGKLQDWQKTGSVYHEIAPAVRATKTAGNWQTMQIVANGAQITIYINGVIVVDANLDEYEKSTTDAKPLKERPRKGFIGLQNYDGTMAFRNVRMKRLDK